MHLIFFFIYLVFAAGNFLLMWWGWNLNKWTRYINITAGVICSIGAVLQLIAMF